MKDMPLFNCLDRAGALLVLILALLVPVFSFSQQLTSRMLGNYNFIGRVAGSSTAGTVFISSVPDRHSALYFNNSAQAIWVGSVTATQNNVTHDNILAGFPVLSSATFELGGVFVGQLAFTCNVGQSVCEIRRLELRRALP